MGCDLLVGNVGCDVWSAMCEMRCVECDLCGVICGMLGAGCDVWDATCVMLCVGVMCAGCDVLGTMCVVRCVGCVVWSIQ